MVRVQTLLASPRSGLTSTIEGTLFNLDLKGTKGKPQLWGRSPLFGHIPIHLVESL